MAETGFHFEQEVATFLALCRTASLATADEQGLPHAANVQYALLNSFELVWLSSPKSVHSQHLALALNPQVESRQQAAITVYAHLDDPPNIHGVQMHGNVSIYDIPTPSDDDHERPNFLLWQTYVNRFPFVIEPPFNRALESQMLYHFQPSWVRWIDNRRGFGFKEDYCIPNC